MTSLMDVFRTVVERVIRSADSCVPDAALAPSRSTTVAQNTIVAGSMPVIWVLVQLTL